VLQVHTVLATFARYVLYPLVSVLSKELRFELRPSN
jgi:hypothetical protein